jgi:hypothetical protein
MQVELSAETDYRSNRNWLEVSSILYPKIKEHFAFKNYGASVEIFSPVMRILSTETLLSGICRSELNPFIRYSKKYKGIISVVVVDYEAFNKAELKECLQISTNTILKCIDVSNEMRWKLDFDRKNFRNDMENFFKENSWL